MPRTLAALAACLVTSAFAFAQPPPQAVLDAVATAKQRLAENRPSDAVAILERQLAYADGHKEFMDALRVAYAAELKVLTDPRAIADVKKNLALLGGAPQPVLSPPVPVIETPLPPPVPLSGPLPPPAAFPTAEPVVALPPPAPKQPDSGGIDLLKQASAVFNLARSDSTKFLEARDLFSSAFDKKVPMTAEQSAAWAYCRVKVAADRLNKSNDAATAAEVVGEVEDALASVPGHAGLQTAGKDVLAAARKRAGSLAVKRSEPANEPGWDAVETDSFRVKHQGNRLLADSVARAAEAKRETIFAKWSAAPGRKWQPKCEIVLHADADAFTRATKASGTGRAEVTLTDGQAVARRIDLRADDATVAENALPRELTHVVLADLFPATAPPKWAAVGMAALAETPDELGRYRRTVPRCDRDGELMAVSKLLAAKDVPASGVTGFSVQSVSLVDFLVRWKGEKHFVGFLRDAQRYGVDSGLKRQYGLAETRQLEAEWRKNVLTK